MVDNNPLIDEFEPIDVEGFDEEIEKTKTPPLEEGKYRLKIYDYTLARSQRTQNRYIKFKCEVIGDTNEENNGRKVQSRILMLEGPGFGFFLDFASTVTPSRSWGKKATKLSLDYFTSFNGCEFLADILIGYEKDSTGNLILDDNGIKKPTGFNDMDVVYSVR